MKTNTFGAIEERASYWSHHFIITYADLTAAATTQTISLVTGVAAGDVYLDGAMRLVTAFSGGAGTNLLLEVGYDLAAGTDDPDAFLAGFEINAAGTEILAGVDDGAAGSALGGYAFLESATITALFTATGANLSTLTAGEVHIFLKLSRLSDFH